MSGGPAEVRQGFDPVDVEALRVLANRYWWMTDGGLELAVEQLFMNDATLELGDLRLSGISAIAEFFRHRAEDYAAQARTTRHFATNFLVSPLGGDRAQVRSLVVLYAGNGAIPLRPGPPSAIADFLDVCVRDDERGWLYQSRRAETIFAGEGMPSFVQARQGS
jgi:hypothetical protein